MEMQERQSGILRLLEKWPWPLVAALGLGFLFVLLQDGKIQLDKVKFARDEGVLSFITGENEIKYQEFLASALDETEYPAIGDVGLFLLVNGAENVQGRLARNLGEICIAVMYAEGMPISPTGICPPDIFANVNTAMHRLETLRYIKSTTYLNDHFQSYELNVLGEQAVSSVRRRRSAAGGEGAKKLGRLDLSYPGLLPEIIKARNYYSEAINGERSFSGL